MVHTKKYREKVALSALLAIFCFPIQQICSAAASSTGASAAKVFKKNQKVEKNKKTVPGVDGFFGYNSKENGNVVFDLFANSLDAKINSTEASIKRSKLLRELLDKVLRVDFSLSQDLYPIDTADGDKALTSKNDLTGTAAFSISIDPGVHILGIPAYMLGIKANKMDELMKQNELYYNISLALFKYLINHQKLRIAEEAVTRFKEHLDGAKARFETGLINEIGLKQAEQNYSHMRSKYGVALVQLQSARENLTKYSDSIDLKQLERFKFSFEKLNLADYISKIVETLPVRKAKADLRYTRSQSIANCVSVVTPTIVISSNDIFGKSSKPKKVNVPTFDSNGNQIGFAKLTDPSNPGSNNGIKVGLRFDLAPVNLMTFSIAVEQNQLAALKLVQAERESKIGLDSNLAEFNLQKKTVEMYRNSAELRRVVADLLRKRDIKDAEKHYSDLLKADSEVAKAYEDLQSQIMYLIESGLKAMQIAGLFVPSDPNQVSDTVNSRRNKVMKELGDESDRILAGKPKSNSGKQQAKASAPISKVEKKPQVQKASAPVNNNNNKSKNTNNKPRKLSKIKE